MVNEYQKQVIQKSFDYIKDNIIQEAIDKILHQIRSCQKEINRNNEYQPFYKEKMSKLQDLKEKLELVLNNC